MEISLKNSSGRFKYRVAAVLLKDDKVLLMTEDRFDFWYLPGGKANFLESSEETLVREINEELSQTPKIERLLWINECFYHFGNLKHHDLAFYYLITLPKDSKIYTQDSGQALEEFSSEKTILHYKWFSINDLEDLKIVPQFLKKSLKSLPTKPQHLITNELSQRETVCLH